MVKRKILSMAASHERMNSGDTARVSGLYGSNHKQCSRASFWVQRDQKLPDCIDCGKSVRFTLLKRLQHISEDADFRQSSNQETALSDSGSFDSDSLDSAPSDDEELTTDGIKRMKRVP